LTASGVALLDVGRGSVAVWGPNESRVVENIGIRGLLMAAELGAGGNTPTGGQYSVGAENL